MGNCSGPAQLLINSAFRIFTRPLAEARDERNAKGFLPFLIRSPLCGSQPHHRRSRLTLLLVCVGDPARRIVFLWLLTIPDMASLRRANPTTTALIETRQAQAEEKGRPDRPALDLGTALAHVAASAAAVVAAEDASFFTHEGFDWEGMKDAAIHDLEKGELKRGGSTITQQLAKNLYLSSERSIFRKAREALITRSLEHHSPKERILELYLNVAEWGIGIYGAEAASRHHFRKPAHDLSEEEAAWLAAILPAPRRYDPLRKTTSLVRRYERVLHRMNQSPRRQTRLE